MTSDVLKFSTEFDGTVKARKVRQDLMEKEELDLCPEMTEWGSRETEWVDPDGCVAEWKVESLGWGREWCPLPALMAKPSNFAWQVPVADVVVGLFGRLKRKCLSGFQMFSGLFLRMTILGLEKWVNIRWEPRNLELLRDFHIDTYQNFHFAKQGNANMTSGFGRQSILGAPLVSG